MIELGPWITGVSFVFGITTLVAAIFGLPVVLARIPDDYFVAPQPPGPWKARVVRNLVGWPLLLVGIVLIPLPGQGLLTVLAGLVLADVPGKRALALFLLRRGPVQRAVDGMRARHGVGPLLLQ
ncbi:MAG: PGPGW domain-containing protein [Myxococcota bacterium]